eukprot:9838406-Alexandrium_andersonii.AAC.1
MAPNPLDEALEGGVEGRVRPPRARYGLRSARGLRIAAGLGAGPDRRITEYSRTWEDLHRA